MLPCCLVWVYNFSTFLRKMDYRVSRVTYRFVFDFQHQYVICIICCGRVIHIQLCKPFKLSSDYTADEALINLHLYKRYSSEKCNVDSTQHVINFFVTRQLTENVRQFQRSKKLKCNFLRV